MKAAPANTGSDASSARLPEHLRILSRPDWVEPVVMCLKSQAIASGVCDEATASRLVIAMSEAITNAVVHGNFELSSELKEQEGAFREAMTQRMEDPAYSSRVVDVRVAYEPGKCVWTVTDQGQGFDVEKVMARLESDDPELMLKSGRGLSIMKAFVDEVWWDQGGQQVHLAVHLSSGRERRGAERHKYTRPVALQREGGEAICQAIARDLSSTGLAMVAREVDVRPGEAVAVTLDLDLPTQRAVTGKVVRTSTLSSGFYDVAVHFDEAIDVEPHMAE